jgi:hypothetical protein
MDFDPMNLHALAGVFAQLRGFAESEPEVAEHLVRQAAIVLIDVTEPGTPLHNAGSAALAALGFADVRGSGIEMRIAVAT